MLASAVFAAGGCLPGLFGGVHPGDPNEVTPQQRTEQALRRTPTVEFAVERASLPAAEKLEKSLLEIGRRASAKRHFVIVKDGRPVGRMDTGTQPWTTPPDKLRISDYEPESRTAVVEFVHETDKQLLEVIERWHFDGALWQPAE